MLAYNLKILMLNSGLSSKKLAEIINVNRSTLIKILNGSTSAPRVETIYSIANYFKISVNELLKDNSSELTGLKDPLLSINIKEKITQLMKKHEIKNVTDLSRLSKIPYSVVEDIMLGSTDNPHISTLQKLADFFDVSIPQILGFDNLTDISTSHAEKAKIPVFDIISLNDFANNLKKILPIKYIESFRRNGTKNTFALFITTNNLLPDFSKGELLTIDAEEAPRTNDFIVAKIEKRAWIFECISITPAHMYLKKVGSFEAKRIEKENIEILGVVIQKVIHETN